jgi:hypothetical protein
MTKYIDALTALEYLLDKIGEYHWRDWLRQDIALWESRKDVSHHLSAYGGMGSFNDVLISVQGGYNVTKMQAPWVNNSFEILKGLCFQLAHSPNKDEIIGDVNSNRFFPILRAFRNSSGGPAADEMIRQLAMTTSQLHGWRCLKCGYGETDAYEVEDYLAKSFLPKYLKNAKMEMGLKALVDAAFAIDFEGISETRDRLRQMILSSDIKIIDREDWIRTCPNCGSNNMAVYRWEYKRNIFKASRDNLPLQN